MAGGFDWYSLRDYNPRAVLSMAHACKLALAPPPTIERVIDTWGLELKDIIDTPALSGLAALTVGGGNLIVAIALKEPIANWLLDTSDDLVNHSAGKAWRDCVEFCEPVLEALEDTVTATIADGGRVWFTGHGVGGAVAALSAMDMPPAVDGHTAYIITFGAPRFVDPQLAHAASNRFFNFSNYQLAADPAPIMPPHCVNAGFQEALDIAAVRRSYPAKLDRAAMKPDRYEALRAQLRTARDAFRGGAEAEGDSPLAATLEGIAPAFLDHRLDRYIAAAGRVADLRDNLDNERDNGVGLQSWSEGGVIHRGVLIPEGPEDSTEVSALLHVARDDWEAPDHIRVLAKIGQIVSVLCTVSELERLSQDPDVISVEESREAGVAELEISVPFVEGDDVQRPPIAERGDRAIVGIIDGGIDILHETFLDGAGKTRILAIWDQADRTGPAPKLKDARLRDFGTLYTAAEIDMMIAAARNGQAPPPRLRDPGEHGTHVASIAAGRMLDPTPGRGMKDGMAPDAKLLVVIPAMKAEDGSPLSIGYSSSHLAALEFLATVASGGGEITRERWPIVVNCSQGMNAGAHDGSSLLEAGFDAITNGGRTRGLVIVKSAGNERGLGGHTRVDAPQQGGLQVVEWNSSATSRRRDRLEFWFSPWLTLAFYIVDPAGNRSGAIDSSTAASVVTLGGNTCRIKFHPSHVDNGDALLEIDISPAAKPIQSGAWTLEITGLTPAPDVLRVDGWVERDDARAINFTRNDDDVTISIPGTAKTVISVAGCRASNPYRCTSSSSSGLDRKGAAKPELIAPGEEIVAARANTFNHKDTMAKTGTSMAAPHVAGAIALALSKRSKMPGLLQPSAQQVRTALIMTVLGANGRHSKDAGYGLLDAVKFVNHIVNLP